MWRWKVVVGGWFKYDMDCIQYLIPEMQKRIDLHVGFKNEKREKHPAFVKNKNHRNIRDTSRKMRRNEIASDSKGDEKSQSCRHEKCFSRKNEHLFLSLSTHIATRTHITHPHTHNTSRTHILPHTHTPHCTPPPKTHLPSSCVH